MKKINLVRIRTRFLVSKSLLYRKKYSWYENSSNLRLGSEICKMKLQAKCFFNINWILKCRRIKFLGQNSKLKFLGKNLLELICGKAILQKCIFYDLLSWNFPGTQVMDIIFESEKSFLGNWNTFVNQWYVKNEKNVFQLAFKLLLFPNFLKCFKLIDTKNSIFNTTAKLKCYKW